MESPLARLRHEAPLLAGWILGWGLCWALGRAWVLDGSLWGYRWPDYIAEAAMVSLRQSNLYDPFRSPLHGGVVAALGEALGSYADAATLVSSASTAAMVLGAGLLARALCGPWEAGLAALLTPTVGTVAWASRWANSYALLSGASGLALGLGACAAAWPGLGLALGAGLASGVAWGTDSRGLLFAAPAGLLVALGATRPGLGWRRWALLPLFAAGLALGPWSGRALGQDPRHSMDTAQKLEWQKGVVERWVRIAPRAEVQAACAELPQAAMLTRGFLGTPCSQEVLRHNVRDNLPPRLPLGLALSAVLLPLGLLPGRRGLRGVLESTLALGAPLGALALLAAFTPLPERYLVQWGVPLAVLGPVGLGRLGRTLLPPRAQGPALGLACVALGLWALWADPAERRRMSADQLDPSYARWNRIAAQVKARLGPEDRLLDCSLVYVDLALLPRRTHGPPYTNTGAPSMQDVQVMRCLSWMEAPETGAGATWIAVQPGLTVEYARVHGGPKQRVDLGESLAQHGGWTRALSAGELELWQWTPP